MTSAAFLADRCPAPNRVGPSLQYSSWLGEQHRYRASSQESGGACQNGFLLAMLLIIGGAFYVPEPITWNALRILAASSACFQLEFCWQREQQEELKLQPSRRRCADRRKFDQ